MKKISLLILCAAILITFAGCGAEKIGEEPEESEGEGSVQISNPIVQYEDAAAVESACGIALNVPENAADTVYSVISGTLAQAKFTLDGVSHTLRGSKTASGIELHGMYYDVSSTERFTSGDISLIYSVLGEGNSVMEWQKDGVNFALSPDSELSGDALFAVASEIVG